MKKSRIIAVFLSAVMALTFLTGCSLFKPTAVSITKKVMKNLDTVKSVKGNIKADYEGPASIEGIEFNLALNSDLQMETVKDSGVSHVKGSVGTELPVFGEISLPVESYMQTGDDKAVVYASMDGENWLKLENDEENEQENEQKIEELPNYKAMLGILQKIVSGDIKAVLAEETEMRGEREVYRMDINVSGELIGEILRAADDMSGEGSSISEDLDFTGADANIVLYVFKDEMLPAAATVDCTALGNLLIKDMLSENGVSVTTDKFVITVDDLEYNTIDELKIPEKVISSAEDASDASDAGLFDNAVGL